MSILTMENVSKKFGSFTALHPLSLTVEEGEAVAIIGSSGSGKSTLLRCINYLEKVTTGTITIAGDTLVEMKNGQTVYRPDQEIRRICTKTGMVFQHFNLFPHLTCQENITIAPIQVLGVNRTKAEQRAAELLEVVGLSSKQKSYPSQLSGGQKQRIAIARALAMEPKVMLFDEPTSALDPETTNEVVSTIKKLVEQKFTMLIVTHDMRFARECATRVIYMDEGRIVEENDAVNFFEHPKSKRLQDFLSSSY